MTEQRRDYRKLPKDVPHERVTFQYRNYRGEHSTRLVQPHRIEYGSTEWHPEAQWLLHGLDLQKNEMRTFAMCDISEWASAAANQPGVSSPGKPSDGNELPHHPV